METQPSARRVVFLLDVDNTLLDNDSIVEELKRFVTARVGAERQKRYWALFAQHREQLGYADYLGTLQRYRIEDPHDPNLLAISYFLLNYPFADRLFPGALDVIGYLNERGTTVILSDGDVVFQPLKVQRSGLLDAVGKRVLIYVHKERELADVELHYPADHYVLIDDKVRLLSAIKQSWGDRVTTVFPRQGHYAFDPEVTSYPPPDITVEKISDILRLEKLRSW
ncbi:MAG: HAD family hydrolase [Gemmatimonadota bacterium]